MHKQSHLSCLTGACQDCCQPFKSRLVVPSPSFFKTSLCQKNLPRALSPTERKLPGGNSGCPGKEIKPVFCCSVCSSTSDDQLSSLFDGFRRRRRRLLRRAIENLKISDPNKKKQIY